MSLVLANDTGGNHCRFGIFDIESLPDGPPLFTRAYPSQELGSFDEGLRQFMTELPEALRWPRRWCAAVAGPGNGREARVTNLPLWPRILADEVNRATGCLRGELTNDFAAVAIAVPHISQNDLLNLRGVAGAYSGTMVITGPGSGLGVAILQPQGIGDYSIVSSEGGHIGFAPRNQLQMRLWAWLRRIQRRVSNESVLCGPGLFRLFQFMQEQEVSIPPALRSTNQELKQFMDTHPNRDPAAIISRLGMTGEDPSCRAALDLFCEVLGAVAGDYALLAKATGGVYLVGGVIRGIIDYLLGNAKLLEAFLDKNPQKELMETVPLYAVKSDPGLLGAALHAAGLE